MRRYLVPIVICIALLLPSVALAQQSASSESLITVRKSELPADLLKKIEMERKIQAYGEYVGLGEEIGHAVDATLTAVSENAVKFAETDVGKLAIFLVVWKVIGKDFTQLVIGIFLLIVGFPIFIWVWTRNCINRRILKNVTKEGDKEYEVIKPDSKTQWSYGVSFFVYIGMALIVMLV